MRSTHDRVEIAPLTAEDGSALQRLFEALPDRETAFASAGPADAVSTFVALPPTCGYDDKHLLGLWADGELAGAVDLIAHFPVDAVWTVGMLVIHGDHRGRGLASRLLHEVERLAQAGGAQRVECQVQTKNEHGAEFLVARGYRRLSGSGFHDVMVFDKSLSGW
jgi:ribosomal protein S18 acetylase RimI-like enzyme